MLEQNLVIISYLTVFSEIRKKHWLVVGLSPTVTRGTGGMSSVRVFLRDPNPRVLEKTTENSEQLGRQARPGIEPGTSRLPVFERSYW